jgi:hypothetical protein
MRFVTNDGRLPSSMVVRTPPGHIYTSTLHRRDRAWGRTRPRRRRSLGELAVLAVSLVIVVAVAVAILAPTAT